MVISRFIDRIRQWGQYLVLPPHYTLLTADIVSNDETLADKTKEGSPSSERQQLSCALNSLHLVFNLSVLVRSLDTPTSP